jgi:hypothetical protein
MNITDYVVTIFEYEIIIGIRCSLKTVLDPVLINEIRGIVFPSLVVNISSNFI